ncbi:MAG: hypothetical protein ACRDK2_06015 [Solirubrobacteraceae bacterium]
MVGLAKNTGKTVALRSVLDELQDAGSVVGVTSVGRDGERFDVIDSRIRKPSVRLWAGSLLATTDSLIRSSGVRYELVKQTGIRTPLGAVVVCRLLETGEIEVAGPSAASDVRLVSEVMCASGAQHVLIDGAIDRRAASCPEVSEAVLMSTGAVLDEQPERVAQRTRDAVELMRLSVPADPATRALAQTSVSSLLIDRAGQAVQLRPRLALDGGEMELARLLRRDPTPRSLVLRGAVCEPFLDALVRANRGRELEVVVQDSTKVFLSRHSYAWYRAYGLTLRALSPIRLLAITVNPLAPCAHRVDSDWLRGLIESEIDDVPVLDVLHPSYVLGAAA